MTMPFTGEDEDSMLSLMLLMSGVGTVIPHDILAEPTPLLTATRGLVRDATPRLGYDFDALAASRDEAPPRFRLSYAGLDELGRDTERRDVLTAYQIAADLTRAEDEVSQE